MTDERKLEILTEAFVKVLSLRSCEAGEKSHALWCYTDKLWNLIKEVARKES